MFRNGYCDRMRVLVLGSEGQLGSEICIKLKDHAITTAAHGQVDIARLAHLRDFAQKVRPEIIINAAGYTDVDGCEANKETAFLVNAIGARNAAIAAREAGADLIHISTDYVFDGRKKEPYVECDMAMPLNNYGWSKLLGERMAMEQNTRSFILRIAWLYGPAGRNFVKTILALANDKDELRVVDDQRGTPTFAGDVAKQIKLLMDTESYGLYHCTSQGSCTWYDFAKEILRLAGISTRVKPVTSAEYPRPARRPASSVLDNLMLRVQGLDIMPPRQDSLARHIGEIKESIEA